MITRLMYVLPLILGRTFNIKKNTVGVDIFPLESISHPRVIQENYFQSSFKIVESSSDVKEMLSVKGDLSLSIKAGMLTFKGIGSYIKESINSQDSVDILTRVSFTTVSKTLPHSARPVATWFSIGRQYLGTHFVRSILYGGDLIACVRFKAVKSEYLQDIKATIKGSLEAGTALDLVGEGKLETLDKELEKKATMEINYYATVPTEGVPNTIDGLRDLIKNFVNHVQKVNDGLGVPVEVELEELSSLDQRISYLKNMDLETELQFFEEYFDDLLNTKSRIKSWIATLPDTLSKEQEKQVSDFSERISAILKKFSETIANLNIEENTSQLDAAKAAYREGKRSAMAGKFRRELNKLMKNIVLPNEETENRGSSTYIHYGSSICTDEKYTSTVFPGYLVSTPRNVTGSGFNYLCFPKSPAKGTDEQSLLNDTSLIAGVKYGLLETRPFQINVDNTVLRGVTCAMCQVKQRQSVSTFLGHSDCPKEDSWVLQYTGYIMSSDVNRAENICVDSKTASHQDSDGGYFDQTLDFVLVQHDNENKFLPCAVCSK